MLGSTGETMADMTSRGDKGPKRALGRGLSALIPAAALGTSGAATANAAPVPVAGSLPAESGAIRLSVQSIHRDARQPRKDFDESKLVELSESIKAQGLIQPVLVRKDSGGSYRLIAGERRWRAAQMAGLSEIPVIVRDVSEAEAFELALVENLQRADLNPIEEAEGYQRLLSEFHLTQAQVSERVGKDRSTVANALRLLGLPSPVKLLLSQGRITMGHARALLGAPSTDRMVELGHKVFQENLSVRETERLVKEDKEPAAKARAKPSAEKAATLSPAARAVVDGLQRRFGTKVHLRDRGGSGTIEIDFFSYEDLERLLSLLQK